MLFPLSGIMINYIIRRILQAVVAVFVLLTILFIMLNVLPGDVALLSGDLRMAQDEEVIENVREKWGLNDPLPVQYFRYMSNLLRGDLGTSYRTSQQVMNLMLPRVANTLKIVSVAFVFAVSSGILLGFVAALNKGSIIDVSLMILAIIGISMPRFWLGLMLMYLFAVILGVLPAAGAGGGSFLFMILPAATLSIPMIALIARTTRSSVLDVINEDYVRTARAKGLRENTINYRHVFRNSLLSIITIVGLQLGTIIANTVVVEKVFSWPGIGNLVVNSIFKRDIPAIQGCILFFALGFIIINLTVDIFYGLLDPRITYS
ncbi:MAG: ABC transporter permease [Halanaerobiales bacterium]